MTYAWYLLVRRVTQVTRAWSLCDPCVCDLCVASCFCSRRLRLYRYKEVLRRGVSYDLCMTPCDLCYPQVEEALTEPERAELARAAAVTDRLSHAETQLDETLFLLQTCLRYSAVT